MTERPALQARYREALQRRLAAAPEAVQRLLAHKLAPAAAPAQPTPPAPAAPAARRAAPPPSPLARLNEQIAQATGQRPGVRGDLRSAQAFRETWARICAEDEVQQAVQRGPEQAGPLNSHMLVLRTLSLLSELSPDYLRRFMVQADTLLWLDEASAQLKPGAAARAKKARQKK